MIYTINACAINDVQKIFNRYAKKANKIGLTSSLTILKEYPKEVTTYEVDELKLTKVRTGTAVIDVMDIDIEFPEYKLGNYTVAAYIEHGQDNNNLVYGFGDFKIPSKYNHGQGVCKHCKTNRMRSKTFVLIDNETNEYKQVGHTCLKEYTGVNDISLVSAYRALNEIVEENLSDNGFTGIVKSCYYSTIDYLTKCIHVYTNLGYSSENKYLADKLSDNDITEFDKETANKVVEFFNEFETDDTFLNNVKSSVTREYCRQHNGFIAYSYIAYLKEMDKIAKLERNKCTEYFGNVGDKVNINVTGSCITSYDSVYGSVYIYKFLDTDNHAFIWKTSKCIEHDGTGNIICKLSGTIKEHNEYREEKQTVLTRCKISK